MEDLYEILGMSPSASDAEIKSQYRTLAMQHHPDRGGDGELFKKISAAYDVLGDTSKRAQYDHSRNTTAFGFNFADMFGAHSPFVASGFEEIFGTRIAKNRDINIEYSITLTESYTGKSVDISYTLPNGTPQTVSINIPAGITHHGCIRYNNIGINTIPNIPRGDLNVIVLIIPDPNFSRVNDDLYTNIKINPIEAIIGCEKTITHLSGATHNIKIRPGISAGTEFAISGQGFKNLRNGQRGRFVGILDITPLTVSDPDIIAQLTAINAKIAP